MWTTLLFYAGCSQGLKGDFSFRVAPESVILQCQDTVGTEWWSVYVASKAVSGKCLCDLPEEVVEQVEPGFKCIDLPEDACGPPGSSVIRNKYTLQAWMTPGPEGLAQSSGEVALWRDCSECRDAEDEWDLIGDEVELYGMVEVVEDLGSTALVSFDLDGVAGELELEVCR
jgi:hypothetical protein